jgi:hypothetical protein
MGTSHHVPGAHNAPCLIAPTLMTGQIGRPGTGLHPLRGQNNVQGASDAGLIPMMFPDYQRVDNPEANARFEKFWGRTLDKKPGLTVVEIMDAACDGKIKGMYIMGENPAMSDPNAHHAREGLARMEHLVVQDIFLTETATCRRDPARLRGRRGPHRDEHRPHGAEGGARSHARRRARTCGSSSSSPTASAAAGSTPVRRAASPRSTRRCARR